MSFNLPDGCTYKSIDDFWGDAPEWKLVWSANSDNVRNMVMQAFHDYPLNSQAEQRTAVAVRVIDLFNRSLDKYMPALGGKTKEKLSMSYDILLEVCAGNSVDGASDQITDYTSICLEALEKHYSETDSER